MRARLKLIKQSIERTQLEVRDPIGAWSMSPFTKYRTASYIKDTYYSFHDISKEASHRLCVLNKLYREELERGGN
tara:strand:+ start:725 stop:949 length:225 start_codon:yes stop_codon:yes gene_type:complete